VLALHARALLEFYRGQASRRGIAMAAPELAVVQRVGSGLRLVAPRFCLFSRGRLSRVG